MIKILIIIFLTELIFRNCTPKPQIFENSRTLVFSPRTALQIFGKQNWTTYSYRGAQGEPIARFKKIWKFKWWNGAPLGPPKEILRANSPPIWPERFDGGGGAAHSNHFFGRRLGPHKQIPRATSSGPPLSSNLLETARLSWPGPLLSNLRGLPVGICLGPPTNFFAAFCSVSLGLFNGLEQPFHRFNHLFVVPI